jgi:tetrapyrrole methylase family protein/MazG family protein
MKTIVVVGLGPGNRQQVTEEARKYLTGNNPVYFRTVKHAAARYYYRLSHNSYSFDYLYDQKVEFEEIYRAIIKKLFKATRRHNTVCYAVPGHPSAGEASVSRLRSIAPRLGVRVKIVEGLSFFEPVLSHLKLDLLDGITVLDALAIDTLKDPCPGHLILAQVYSRRVASRVKLRLLELYSPQLRVTIINSAGMKCAKSFVTRLGFLDHHDIFNHYTTIYLPPLPKATLGALIETMALLRAPDGCPWDKEQTHYSLRQYLIEEAYEVVAAIDNEDDRELVEELGDLLLQVVFHSQIAREENRFDLYDVIEAIIAKLVRRHPHVFGMEKAKDAADVKVLWEQIKADEKKENKTEHAIKVDHELPALLKAYKLQKRAAEKGFDWTTLEGPLAKAREELEELIEACSNEDRDAMEEELGDYIFTIVNIARFLKINPELALGRTIGKFVDRFDYIMEKVSITGKEINCFSLDQLDYWWEEAKKIRKISK